MNYEQVYQLAKAIERIADAIPVLILFFVLDASIIGIAIVFGLEQIARAIRDKK